MTDKLVITGGGRRGVGCGISEGFLAAAAYVNHCGRTIPEVLPSVNGTSFVILRGGEKPAV